MFKKTIMAAAVALVSLASSANAVTVGNAATDRALSDNFSNFGLAFTGIGFIDGVITGWETYIERINGNVGTGTMGLLVLRNIGGTSYEVKGVDVRSVSTGLNQFAGTSIAASSSDILGVYMGDAKVSYDLVNQPSGPDQYTSNLALGVSPIVGDVINFSLGSTDRTYSLNATVAPVPLPATGLLLIGALGGIGLMRRRKQS